MTLGPARNPWIALPDKPPYFLAEDVERIERFNEKANERTRIQPDVLPEPFLGNPLATVVLLALNPGFKPDDRRCHADPLFAKLSRDSLAHRAAPCPFYLLDQRVAAPGRDWWRLKLRHLLDEVGEPVVANQVLCVEYFGYHSEKFAHERLRLPSQQYGFWLVEQALERGALVVIMRGRHFWLEAVPGLESYDFIELTSKQNVAISPGNCRKDFPRIVERLQGSLEE